MKRKILIHCGTGGVGKTTVSAARGLLSALRGDRAVVVTLDPAKRLATSLGLEGLGDQPTDLTPHLKVALQKLRSQDFDVPETVPGSLHALMPDTRRTFEQLVVDLGFSAEGAEKLIKNPIFEIFAREFSGTNEYMAVQRLHRLNRDPQFDRIILDTPPSRNTLDFLNAPKLLTRFYEEKALQWLLAPSSRLAAFGMHKALDALEKLTGGGFMTHLVGFVASLFEVQENFSKNLREVTALLEGSSTGFIMVASPAPEHVLEVSHFAEGITRRGYHFDGLILNRSLAHLGPLTGIPAVPAWDEARRILEGLQAREKRGLEALVHGAGIPDPILLPELARDVHSVEDLVHVAMALDRSSLGH